MQFIDYLEILSKPLSPYWEERSGRHPKHWTLLLLPITCETTHIFDKTTLLILVSIFTTLLRIPRTLQDCYKETGGWTVAHSLKLHYDEDITSHERTTLTLFNANQQQCVYCSYCFFTDHLWQQFLGDCKAVRLLRLKLTGSLHSRSFHQRTTELRLPYIANWRRIPWGDSIPK